jgi:Rrf2 family transcriptional regulator, iron-sulfur cluster assembly transcription factor
LELTTKGRYAVMAMADLAKNARDDAMPLSAIAERQQLSIAYLEQIFLKLRRAGLVESERGRSGGYRLTRAPGEIMVAEVMSAVEEDTRMTRCHGPDSTGCIGEQRCLTHGLWDALGDHIRDFLAQVSLDDVLTGRLGPSLPPELALPVAATSVAPQGVSS